MFKSVSSWFVYLGLLLAVGFAAWVLAPSPSNVKLVQPRSESWQLPEGVHTNSAKAIAILSGVGNNLWGKLPEVEQQKPLTPPDWRIIASVSQGESAFVIIKFDDTQLEQKIKVGEELPGGNKIIGIGLGKVCVLLNGKKRSLVF